MEIKKKDIFTILALGIMLFLCNLMFQDKIIVFIFASMALLTFIFETYRRSVKIQVEARDLLKNDIRRSKRHLEALFSIFSIINPQFPLPNTGGWAACPDFLKKLIEIIYQEKPKLVVEAGSGVSSLIVAYCLKQIGSKLISLEHDAKYAKRSEDLIRLHGLSDVAKIIHAPLSEVELNNEKWPWYDIENIKFDMPIDLFIIDGPPARIGKFARYPSLPVMFDSLSENSTIFLDDGEREEEVKIVERWKKELKHIRVEFLYLERGAFLIKKYCIQETA